MLSLEKLKDKEDTVLEIEIGFMSTFISQGVCKVSSCTDVKLEEKGIFICNCQYR